MATLSRRDYAAMYGPTTGDGFRLGDTSLVAVVEKDFAVYGDECLHGGGKTLRDGAGLAAGGVGTLDHGDVMRLALPFAQGLGEHLSALEALAGVARQVADVGAKKKPRGAARRLKSNAGRIYRPDSVRRVTPAGNHSSAPAIAGRL